MKAIFIDAENREVKEVTLPENNTLQAVYPMMGKKCSLVEGIFYFNNFDLLLGDEEAYYNDYFFGFIVDGYGYIHGNAIRLGSDADGENADVDPYLLSLVQKKVTFAEPKIVAYNINKVMDNPIKVTSWNI